MAKRLGDNSFKRIARTFSGNAKLEVNCDTMNCATDGHTIYIPMNSPSLDKAHQQVIQGMIDHETSHCHIEYLAKLAGVESPMQARLRLPKEYHLLANVFMDIKDERHISEQYQGCQENIKILHEWSLHLNQAQMARGELNLYDQVIFGAMYHYEKTDISWLSKEAQKYIHQLQPELKEAGILEPLDTQKLIELTRRTYDKIKALIQQSPKSEGGKSGKKEKSDNSSDSDDGNGNKNDQKQESGGGFSQDISERLNKLWRGEDPGKSEVKRDQAAPTGPSITDPMQLIQQGIVQIAYDQAKSTEKYVTSSLVKDEVQFANKHPQAEYDDLSARIRPHVATLRSKLLTLLRSMKESHRTVDLEQGELDVDVLYRVKTGTLNVFTELHKGIDLNTAVMILRDFSGSMAWGDPSGFSEYTVTASKFGIARDACAAITESLDQLNIPVEVISFQNSLGDVRDPRVNVYRGGNVRISPIQYTIFKQFSESYRAVKTRFLDGVAHGDNSDADAIMFAAKRLAQRPEQRKILIVLSDGQPACGGVKYELLRDATIEVIKEVSAANIEIVGVGILHHTTEMYKHSMVIQNLKEMAPMLFRLFKKLLLQK